VLEAVSRVLHGEVDAFEVIVREYQGMVRRICRSIVPLHEDAEDAGQEVFLRAYRALSSFRLDRRFTPWIVSIALNTAKSHYRKSGRISSMRSTVGPEQLPGTSFPERESERHFVEKRVRTAVLALPERLREAAYLYYLEELDVADVAEAMNIGKENVKSRLHRARAILRAALEEDATDA